MARSETKYDSLGRSYEYLNYSVDPSTGSVGNSLTGRFWYDPSGNIFKEFPSGSDVYEKIVYDGVNRATKSYAAYNQSDSSYPYPVDASSDIVLNQNETTYDDAVNAIKVVSKQRYHSAGPTEYGALTRPLGSNPKAREYFLANYPDAVGRTIVSANYGTKGGSGFIRPEAAPSRSDIILVQSVEYNDRGELYLVTDPKGLDNQSEFDYAGRLTKKILNYVDGIPGSDSDVTTEHTYNADGLPLTLTAKNASTGDQTTTFTYGTTLSDSDIARNDLLRNTEYPASSSGEEVEYTCSEIPDTQNKHPDKDNL